MKHIDQAELRAQAYQDGLSAGRIQMGGGMGGTQSVESRGATLLKTAAWKGGMVGLAGPDLIQRVTTFHAERLEALPDRARYPELAEERAVLAERYRGMADAGMSDELIALHESMGFWFSYRCRAETGKLPQGGRLPPEQRERCRVVFAPETDHGPIHFKNVDDPLHTWRPLPENEPTTSDPFTPLFFDGTGSGLHIDDVPPEIFPVDAVVLARRLCETVAEAEELLSRYNYFWGSANLLIHDIAGNAIAFDKSSRCRFALRRPGPNGVIYVNGMSSFDPDYEAFIEAKRDQYLRESEQNETTPEGAYFQGAKNTLANMQRRMAAFEKNPTEADLYAHLSSRDPDGPLCRPGIQAHPDEPTRDATLLQRCYYPRERIMRWRQWKGETPVWEDTWKRATY